MSSEVTNRKGVLFCSNCQRYAEEMEKVGLVGRGTVFPRACPHIELIWDDWLQEELKIRVPPFKKLMVPMLIGFIFGIALGLQLADLIVGSS